MDRTEVSAAARGGAVGVARGEVGEVGLASEDLVAEVEEARGGVGAGGGGDDAAVGVLPGGLAAGALVLDEDVRRPHRLPLSCRRRRHADALPFSAADRSLARSAGPGCVGWAWLLHLCLGIQTATGGEIFHALIWATFFFLPTFLFTNSKQIWIPNPKPSSFLRGTLNQKQNLHCACRLILELNLTKSKMHIKFQTCIAVRSNSQNIYLNF